MKYCRGVSPLIAIVALTVVVVAVSILFALWSAGLVESHLDYFGFKVNIVEGYYAVKTIFVDLKNTGSKATSITNVFVNREPAELEWAWDLIDNRYLGNKNPLLKPGHRIRIAIKSPKTLKPGTFVEIKLLTSHGVELYKMIRISGHKALDYINNGYFRSWDYDPSHKLAIYRDYYTVVYDNNELPDLPKLSTNTLTIYDLSFNMWYSMANLNVDETIIFEIALFDGENTWSFIDLIAKADGRTYVRLAFDNLEVDLGVSYLDPHNYKVVFKPFSPGIVEIKFFIDNRLVFSYNTTKVYDWIIANICFGVWNEASMHEMYLDKLREYIEWIAYGSTSLYEEFDDKDTSVFTSYIVENTSAITGYPVILYDGLMGFGIEK